LAKLGMLWLLVGLLAFLLVSCVTLPVAELALTPPALTSLPTPLFTPSPSAAASPTPTRTPMASRTRAPTLTPRPSRTPTIIPSPRPARIGVTVGPFRSIATVDNVLPGTFSRLYAAPDGALWLITNRGIAKLQDTTWVVHLSELKGTPVGIDAEGQIWLVSQDTSKISVWRKSRMVYDASAGWASLSGEFKKAHWGQFDRMGRFWLATSQDVRVFDGQRWTIFTPKDMGMRAIEEQDDRWSDFHIEIVKDQVWVGECDWGGPGPLGGQGARWFDGRTWQGTGSPVASGCVTVIKSDRLGRIWLGVGDGLWRHDPVSGNWRQFPFTPESEHQRSGFVSNMALDPSGDPWVILALCGGASCYNGHAVYHLHQDRWVIVADQTFFETVGGPVFDATGTPWLLWDGKVYRAAENTPELVAEMYVTYIATNTAGQTWLVGRHGDRDLLWTLR